MSKRRKVTTKLPDGTVTFMPERKASPELEEVACCATCDYRDTDYDSDGALTVKCKKYNIVPAVWMKCNSWKYDMDSTIEDETVRVPFTRYEVVSLNEYQESGFGHPYTCGNDSSHILVATINGWTCPKCNYTQNWAHKFTADFSWKLMKPLMEE